MSTQYLVRKVETCPVCNGERVLYNPEWAELNAQFDQLCRNRRPDDTMSLLDQLIREK